MRRVLIFFCVLILSHCGNSKQVYWCGDHPCVNEKERESYFKENMIVEIRDIKKIKKQTKSEVKKIKEDLKKKEKLDKEKQKELKKQAKIEEKIALEESKNIKIKNKNKTTCL